MYVITPEDPESPDAVALIQALSHTLSVITGDSGQSSFSAEDVRGPRACFLVARSAQGQALGCGAFRPLQGNIAELKRMYAQPNTQGVGSALLVALEARAQALGYVALWLSTRVVNQRAVAFYQRQGYQPIPPFGKYVGQTASLCLGKHWAEGSA